MYDEDRGEEESLENRLYRYCEKLNRALTATAPSMESSKRFIAGRSLRMEVSDVRELRRLREENARLKKLVAERDLEVEVMKEIQAKKWCARRHGGLQDLH